MDHPVHRIVFVQHYRIFPLLSTLLPEKLGKKERSPFNFLSKRGGATVCVIEDLRTRQIHIGVAECSFGDIFSKSEGMRVAYTRAEIAAAKGIPLIMGNSHHGLGEQALRQIPLKYLLQQRVQQPLEET